LPKKCDIFQISVFNYAPTAARLPLPSAYIARALISLSHMLSLVNVLSII